MSVVGNNYAKLETKRFEKKFGSVIEGVDVSEFYRANYYAVFVSQRMAFAATLVFLYEIPFV